MAKGTRKTGSSRSGSSNTTTRREDALSRERIVEASIEILDREGESGLTFRALSERLSTGPGAIYWHIANKSDLLLAACDALVAATLERSAAGSTTPKTAIRALALGLFDAMDAHPWVGSALLWAAGQSPMIRIFEHLGQQIRALGVPAAAQWTAVSVLLNYIIGVGGQNAANAQRAQTSGADRAEFLDAVATAWSQLDPKEHPFTRSVAGQLRTHDDRTDFAAGIDLILSGLTPTRRR